MLTKEVADKNKKSFLSAVKAYNICRPELITKMEEMGLFTCPASTMVNLHNAFEGGLVDHALRVAGYAVKISETLPENIRPTKESVIRVSLLHGLGKVGLYTPCTSDWHRKNLGKMYEFNENIISMTIGERSIYYIMSNNNGDMITNVEYQAILNFEKTSDDAQAEWHTEALGNVLRMAIKLAIIEEKSKLKL